jgi:hypothetical protein
MEEWKQRDDEIVPTPSNINYWFRQQDTLLVQYPQGNRAEITIAKVAKDGVYFAVIYNAGFVAQIFWFRHDEIRVLAVFPKASASPEECCALPVEDFE